MRITIDTREDSFEDALSVLRRAYGRHRLAHKTEESPAVPEAVGVGTSGGVVEEADNQSAFSAGRRGAGLRKASAKGIRRSASKRTSATSAAKAAVSKSTEKRAPGKKAAPKTPARGRSEAPRKRSSSGVASNTAPPGQSEAVRAWAKEQGMQLSARGRMPAKVITAYREAHND